MPPESLFRHSLSLRTPFRDIGFLNTLRYPNTFRSESQIKEENQCFMSSLPSDSHVAAASVDDLCFSLDDCACEPLDPSRFFYKDCSGVVSIGIGKSDGDEADPQSYSGRTFLLPSILSAECANFIHRPLHVPQVSGRMKIIIPSHFWALKSEVEAWSGFPTTYSYFVLCVACALDTVDGCGLQRWIISNSPRFGILIDAALKDHIFLLLKLCLKSIRTEAVCSLSSQLSDKLSISNLKAMNFESPKLVCNLAWLASQLSVLYGEANGKLFALGMLKESLLCAGLSCTLFNLEQDKLGHDGSESIIGDVISTNGYESARSKSVGVLQLEKNTEDCDVGHVFISQVAAAVAALHERFFLEEKIKGLRFHQSLPKSQILKEYLYASTRANEIREKRPDYRAVSEHDGLLWQGANDQDPSKKAKTREELLAEDRDFKRRRMSYRGKKGKRNTTEVLRDIIEKQMEEIMRAGGIGYEATSSVDVFSIDQKSSDRTAKVHEVPCGNHDVTKSRLQLPHFGNGRPEISNDLKVPKKELRFKCSEHHEQRKHKEAKNCEPTSTSSYRNHDNVYAENCSYTGSINDSTLESPRVFASQGDRHILESKGATRGRDDYFTSKFVTAPRFEDRYDPSASYDECDDSYHDFPLNNDHLRTERHHSPTNNMNLGDMTPATEMCGFDSHTK